MFDWNGSLNTLGEIKLLQMRQLLTFKILRYAIYWNVWPYRVRKCFIAVISPGQQGVSCYYQIYTNSSQSWKTKVKTRRKNKQVLTEITGLNGHFKSKRRSPFGTMAHVTVQSTAVIMSVRKNLETIILYSLPFKTYWCHS